MYILKRFDLDSNCAFAGLSSLIRSEDTVDAIYMGVQVTE